MPVHDETIAIGTGGTDVHVAIPCACVRQREWQQFVSMHGVIALAKPARSPSEARAIIGRAKAGKTIGDPGQCHRGAVPGAVGMIAAG